MIIAESIRVEVYKYNYAAHSYDLVTTLTESSVISAGGKRQCCADGTFEIGGVYAATFSMQAKIPGMTTFQVRGAKLRVRSKYGTESAWHILGHGCHPCGRDLFRQRTGRCGVAGYVQLQ